MNIYKKNEIIKKQKEIIEARDKLNKQRKNLIQLFIDTVEKDKQDIILKEYNKANLEIKKLNKRITLIDKVLYYG